MNGIQKISCIQFEESNSARDYINIWKGKGCNSLVGRQGGAQDLSLAEICLTSNAEGGVQHEFMHALGFQHMHQAHNRDKYIRINKGNIEKGFVSAFDKISKDKTSFFGTSYDLDSIMQYDGHGFAIDKAKPTIETIDPKDQGRLNKPTSKMSPGDIKRLNNMYECNEPKSNKHGKRLSKKVKQAMLDLLKALQTGWKAMQG